MVSPKLILNKTRNRRAHEAAQIDRSVLLWIWPGYSLMRCHLHTQLSSGLITAISPSKLLLVQSYTLSLLFFMRRNSSQLSQPSVSNWSKDCDEMKWQIFNVLANWMQYILCSRIMSAFTLTNEQTKHARNPRKSFGTVSKDIFAVSSRTHLFPIGRHRSSNDRACFECCVLLEPMNTNAKQHYLQ